MVGQMTIFDRGNWKRGSQVIKGSFRSTPSIHYLGFVSLKTADEPPAKVLFVERACLWITTFGDLVCELGGEEHTACWVFFVLNRHKATAQLFQTFTVATPQLQFNLPVHLRTQTVI